MKNILKQKSAISMLVAAIVIIIVVVAAAGAGYYYTTLKPAASSTPSASPTASPAGTSTPAATESPTVSTTPATSATPGESTQPIANFRAGAYANYTVKTFNNVTGAEESSMPLNWDVADGGSAWVLTMSTTFTSDGSITQSLTIMNLDKTTNKPTTGRFKVITDGVVIMDQAIDLTSPEFSDTGTAEIDPSTIIGQETITVVAGTFTCQKAVTSENGATGTSWISSNVPIWGIVKTTSTEGTIIVSSTELIDYSR